VILLNKLENKKYVLKVASNTSSDIPRLVATINVVTIARVKICVTVNTKALKLVRINT